MLTSIICAPFSTCWRATASASRIVAVQDQPREGLRAGNVGALAHIDEQRVVADVERLQPGQAQLLVRLGARRAERNPCTAAGDGADMRRRGAAAAAHDVEEARARKLAAGRRPCTRATRRTRPSRWAGRHSGAARCGYRRLPASSSMCGRRSFAPSAQFRPTENGRACATEFQNAPTVWPDSVRPERSVIVPEIITGRRTRRGARTSPRSRRSPPWR